MKMLSKKKKTKTKKGKQLKGMYTLKGGGKRILREEERLKKKGTTILLLLLPLQESFFFLGTLRFFPFEFCSSSLDEVDNHNNQGGQYQGADPKQAAQHSNYDGQYAFLFSSGLIFFTGDLWNQPLKFGEQCVALRGIIVPSEVHADQTYGSPCVGKGKTDLNLNPHHICGCLEQRIKEELELKAYTRASS